MKWDEFKMHNYLKDPYTEISCQTCRYASNVTSGFCFCKIVKHPLTKCIDREYYYWESKYKATYVEDFINRKEMEL